MKCRELAEAVGVENPLDPSRFLSRLASLTFCNVCEEWEVNSVRIPGLEAGEWLVEGANCERSARSGAVGDSPADP